MKERGILFSAPMVRALLAGTKTQTRRVVKAGKCPDFGCHMSPGEIAGDEHQQRYCPYGEPGDRLWVRESWASNEGTSGGIVYRADHGAACGLHQWDLKTGALTTHISRWRPSIHMPRAASRILLEITEVRVERLQDISDEDAQAEGCDPWEDLARVPGVTVGDRLQNYRLAYQHLWNQINGAGAWDANPWVWAVTFRRITS